MKIILSKKAFVAALLVIVNQAGLSQGSFVNLDFEHPVLPLITIGGNRVAIENGLPGWTGYLGGIPVDWAFHDTVSIGGAAISLHDLDSNRLPLDGSYSVLIQPSTAGPLTIPAIAQSGLIPQDAMSLTFFASPAYRFETTFAGMNIPLFEIGATDRYVILAGDLSQFAGQMGELRFQGSGFLDNIQFSSQPIPEPGTLALFGLGGLLAGFARWQVSRRK